MIEKGHLMAFQQAQKLTDEAMSQNRLDEAIMHVKQSIVIIELQQAKQELLAKYGVEDLPIDKSWYPVDHAIKTGKPIAEFRDQLGSRVYNALARNDVEYIEDLDQLSDKTLLLMYNIGKITLRTIRNVQKEYGSKS